VILVKNIMNLNAFIKSRNEEFEEAAERKYIIESMHTLYVYKHLRSISNQFKHVNINANKL